MNAHRYLPRIMAVAGSVLFISWLVIGSGRLSSPIAADPTPSPIAAYSALSIGCNGDHIDRASGFDAEARIDPEWAQIQSPPTILEGTVSTPDQQYPNGGESAGNQSPSEVAETDIPWTHYTHDKTSTVQPDPEYQYLLSYWTDKDGNFVDQHHNMEVEWDNGSSMYELFASSPYSDRDHGAMPEFVWPSIGNRVWVEGQWIFDCGHTGLTGHTVTIPNCCEGGAPGCCSLPGCCTTEVFYPQEVQYATEIHPPRAIVTYRLNHPTTTILTDATSLADELPGGSPLPVTGDQTQVPVTEADIFVSARGGGAIDHCSLITRHLDAIDGLLSLGLTGFDDCTHTGPIIPVNDRNYVFDIYPPGTDYSTKPSGVFPVNVPTRDGSGTDVSLQWRTVDHSSEIPNLTTITTVQPLLCPIDATTLAPTQAETSCPPAPARPTRLRVILPFAGSNANAFAQSIFLGWDDVPAPPLEPQVRTFQVRLHEFDVRHNGEGVIHHGHGDWRVFVDVGGQWKYVSGLPFDRNSDGGNACNGDSLTNNDDNDCFRYVGQPWTVSVLDGNPIHIAVGGFESDSVDDNFCTSPTGCDPNDDAAIALALEDNDRVGTLEFDLDPAQNYQVGLLNTRGIQQLGPLGFLTPRAGGDSTNYQVTFTVDEVPALEPPVSTLSVGTPLYANVSSGVTYVSSATPLALGTTSTDVVGFQYRFHRNGLPLPVFPSGLPFDLHWTGTDFQPGPRSASVFLNGFDGADGQYILQYSAQTANGLTEPRNTARLTLDNTPPVSTIIQPTATQYLHSAMLTLSYSVSDGTGSGVQSFTPLMDNATTLANHGLQSGQEISLLKELSLGAHTFTINALDNVANAGSTSVTFTIIVTAESIKDDVRQFLASGDVTLDEGNSLLGILDAAASARARGDCATANRLYQAFIRELQVQSGKRVSAMAAAIMIADAQYLIAHCP